MPYGFNDDKSRYDLQDDLDRISALEAAAGFDPTIFDDRFEAIEDDIGDIETAVGISSNKNANTFYAAPNGSNGPAGFRNIVKADLPALATTDISGLGAYWAQSSVPETIGIEGEDHWSVLAALDDPLPAGRYIVIGHVRWAPHAGGYREICISEGYNLTTAEKKFQTDTIEVIDGGRTAYRAQQVVRFVVSDGTFCPYLNVRQNTGDFIDAIGRIWAIRIR